MTDVKSKNLYELLGNTSDQDSDREPEPPTQAIEKPTDRRGKRDAPQPAAAEPADSVAARGRGGNRRGGFTGSEAAFRDRATGRRSNREQPTEENNDDGTRGRGRGRGRGGPRRGGDRQSRTGVSDHPKQVGHGWGDSTAQGELQDEKAGDAIATEEKKDGDWDAGNNTDVPWVESEQPAHLTGDSAPIAEPEPEPEDTSKSYAEYLQEQAAKRLEGLGLKEARAPNEGAKDNKKWKSAKPLSKEEDENYFKGEDKARRERERKQHAKEFVDIDYTFKEQARDARGGARGGRGRGRGGGDRGDRPDRPDRGDFRGRGRGRGGDFRGEHRGEYRGGRGRGRGGENNNAGVAVNDESAFPSLGAK